MTAMSHSLPGDPALPGFSVALDAQQMHERLRPVFHAAGFQLSRLSLDRFRYRSGERAVAVYTIDLTHEASGRKLQTFAAGRMHAGRCPKMRVTSGAEAGLPSRITLSELGMGIEVFPHDRRLPAAAEMMSGPSPHIADLLRYASGRPDAWPEDFHVEPVRYRAGLSATFACGFAGSAPSSADTLFTKVTSGAEIGDDHAAASRASAALSKQNRRYRLALPAAVQDGGRLTIYRRARGKTLAALLSAEVPIAPLAEATAGLLAALHRQDVDRLPDTFSQDLDEKIERAVRLITWACPELERQAFAAGRAALACVRAPLRAPTHRDMKPDHVFLSDEGVELIDNGSICHGNPVTDWGVLDARLALLAAPGAAGAERLECFARDLRTAYFEQVPSDWRHHAASARAYGALIVCTHVIQSLSDGWRELIRAELQSASRMDGLL